MKYSSQKEKKKPVTQKYMDEMMRMYRERLPSEKVRDNPVEIPERDEPVPEKENAVIPPSENSGTLIIEVTTANGDIPLHNAHITVFRQNGDEKHILAFLTTDKSGKTPSITLGAPPGTLSLNPDNTVKPYASYNIYTTMEGFYPVVNNNVPVFSGVSSIQQVNMIPLPQFMTYPDKDIVYNGEEPDLFTEGG